MLKSEVRKLALKERLSLSDETYSSLNQGLLKQFSILDFSGVKALHIFLPIVEKREPNTFLLIEWLNKNHPDIKIIVPKANFSTSSITNHEYLGKTDLQKNLYNILEPKATKIYNGQVDLIVVPLLAFDKQGHRVGYGKGFYDRLLENTNAKKIGLSLFPALAQISDVCEHDIKLDYCLTPTKTIKF